MVPRNHVLHLKNMDAAWEIQLYDLCVMAMRDGATVIATTCLFLPMQRKQCSSISSRVINEEKTTVGGSDSD